MKTLASLLILSFFSHFASAEQVIENERYIAYYNAFNSTAIDANAAKLNNLVRSKYSAMLNIAVFKKSPNSATHTAVKSINSGSVENLVGQQQSLKFVPIKEGSAIYYIASFNFADQEQMNFTVNIQPDPNQLPMPLTFSQKFYVD